MLDGCAGWRPHRPQTTQRIDAFVQWAREAPQVATSLPNNVGWLIVDDEPLLAFKIDKVPAPVLDFVAHPKTLDFECY